MENLSTSECFSSRILISSTPITLKLRRAFNTAHSSSSIRTNFLIKISALDQNDKNSKINFINGYGQCGLPPKKPFCYLSDAQDCKMFVNDLQKAFLFKKQEIINQNKNKMIKNKQKRQQIMSLYNEIFRDVNKNVQNQQKSNNPIFFSFLQEKIKQFSLAQNQQNQMLIYQILILFKQGKQLHKNKYQYSACRSALQFALLDFIGKLYNISVADIIYTNIINQNQHNYSFYTISHQNELEEMIKNGKQSLIHTNCIKIKFNNEVHELLKLLIQLNKQKIGKKWIIDANASWNPQDYELFQKQFMNIVQKSNNQNNLKQKILYVEQPFPIFESLKGNLNEQKIDQIKDKWANIRQKTQFKIVADQSFVKVENLQTLKPYCHGINIKMEKCGGPLQASKILKSFPLYKQYFSQLMFGSMVSTHLGCTQTFQFDKFATYFDIDGALLTAQPNIKGGFQWKGQQGIKKISGNGLTMVDSDIQILF